MDGLRLAYHRCLYHCGYRAVWLVGVAVLGCGSLLALRRVALWLDACLPDNVWMDLVAGAVLLVVLPLMLLLTCRWASFSLQAWAEQRREAARGMSLHQQVHHFGAPLGPAQS